MNCLRGSSTISSVWCYPKRSLALQFVGKVFEEGYVVLCHLRFRSLDWHQRDDAFSVRSGTKVQHDPTECW